MQVGTSAYREGGFLQVRETETKLVFQPLIPYQSLGEYVDAAYKLGQRFAEEHPDRVQRAEQIFRYVRDGVHYTPDIDLWGMPDFAQNADEVANTLLTDGIAHGDCEEYAVLLAVMYQGAGYRSAVVIWPGHSAALLYLPGYERANVIFTLNEEPGWIWLEATGSTNPFGWFPVGQAQQPILAYELSPDEEYLPLWEGEAPPRPELRPSKTRHVGGIILAIVIVSAFLGLAILLGRRGARRSGNGA